MILYNILFETNLKEGLFGKITQKIKNAMSGQSKQTNPQNDEKVELVRMTMDGEPIIAFVVNGIPHRDAHEGPAIQDKEGNLFWVNNGNLLKNSEFPTFMKPDGTIEWWDSSGQPLSVLFPNGKMEIHGQSHTLDYNQTLKNHGLKSYEEYSKDFKNIGPEKSVYR